jgi:hypothetical protein
MSTWQLLSFPGVARVILIYNYVMLLAFTFTAVNPVYLYTPVRLGGIGFTPELIAAVTAVGGLSQAIWLLVVFPRLHKRVGTGRILFYCAFVWPVFFASTVVFNVLLWHDLKAAFWTLAPLVLVCGSGVAMAFSSFPETAPFKPPWLNSCSCCPTCGKRHRAVPRNSGNTELYRFGRTEWHPCNCASACNEHLRHRRKVPHPRWPTVLAIECNTRNGTARSAEVTSSKSGGKASTSAKRSRVDIG